MTKQVQINVSYSGGHNFDYDTALEQLAGKCRCWADMDFESMQRTISFRFDDVVTGKHTPAELFVAAARSTFPEFVVSVAS